MHTLPKPAIIAHRGYSRRFPENTLAAFTAAIDAGAHMIELDVSLSKDRVPVVVHDDTVDRTTDGTGPVGALTMDMLKRLDAGSWFDPQFHAERLPTLEQVLDAVVDRVMVNIEIKPEAVEAKPSGDAIERQILDLIGEKACHAQVLISSFDWRVLDRIRQADARMAIGLLSERSADDDLFRWCRRIRAFSWHPDYRVVTQIQVDGLHALGARVFPYAVGGSIDIDGMLAMGVDGLILDDPREMLQ